LTSVQTPDIRPRDLDASVGASGVHKGDFAAVINRVLGHSGRSGAGRIRQLRGSSHAAVVNRVLGHSRRPSAVRIRQLRGTGVRDVTTRQRASPSVHGDGLELGRGRGERQ